MFGFRDRDKGAGKGGESAGPRVSTKYCTDRFNGKYPHVGLYDCREGRIWICKPLAGQAIRTSHARLITGADNATSTVWKDRFLCFWFYTPNTGEGLVHGYPIEWEEGQVLVRIDGNWDYDRQQLILPELEDQVNENLERQFRYGERVLEFYKSARLPYPVGLHYIGARAVDSIFYVRRIEAGK